MKVLGISYGYHDSSVCLVEDGQLIFHSAEEKFSRIKHDNSFPELAIAYCKEEFLFDSEVDYVCVAENTYNKFLRVLRGQAYMAPTSLRSFVDFAQKWLGSQLWTRAKIAEDFNIKLDNVLNTSHHLSHAFNSFALSGFSKARVMVCDAVGDDESLTFYDFERNNSDLSYRRLSSIKFPSSLCLYYSAITEELGFQPNDSECSTMALSSFGTPVYEDLFWSGFEQDKKKLRRGFLDFYRTDRKAFGEDFKRLVKDIERGEQSLEGLCYYKKTKLTERQKHAADIASSMQSVFEQSILSYIKESFDKYGERDICLAGGAFANCQLNYKILNAFHKARVFVPFSPGDDGNSIGSALYAAHLKDSLGAIATSPYLGRSIKSDISEVAEALGLQKTTYNVKEVSSYIEAGKIVVWVSGRCESGPRALGRRSIICRPDKLDLVMRLNAGVKKRPNFRPYALSMSDQSAKRNLDIEDGRLPNLRWMQYACPVRHEMKQHFIGAVHVDQTTRPQVVYREDNTEFYDLLVEVGHWFEGGEVVLNTSLNESGEPIVADDYEALQCFLRTDTDILVLGDKVFRK